MKKFIISGLSISLLILASCRDKKDPINPNKAEPIVLDCNYFEKNPNAVLSDNPNAPIDYIVTCKMTINNNVIIEPGTTIAFEEKAGFIVESSGSLSAVGNGANKITFTGVKKQNGAWAGIIFFSSKLDNQISNAIIEYGGGDHFNSNRDSGNVIVYGAASVQFHNNQVTNSASYGIHATNHESEISTFENNIFENNLRPIQIHINKIHTIGTSNLFPFNTVNKVHSTITGDIKTARTWRNLNIPYYFASSSLESCIIAADLTIEPGTVMEFGAKTYLTVHPEGSLKAIGTATSPIIFRGEKEIAGYWGCIYFKNSQSPLNEIKYANIIGAGQESYGVAGGVYIFGASKAIIDHVNFINISNCGILGSPNAIANSTIGNNNTFTNTGGEVCTD